MAPPRKRQRALWPTASSRGPKPWRQRSRLPWQPCRPAGRLLVGGPTRPWRLPAAPKLRGPFQGGKPGGRPGRRRPAARPASNNPPPT
eukprot:scaffold218906_cov36-Prasinocladus_malaysianus.AAC.1